MNEKYLIPLSIIIAGAVIGGAVIFSNNQEPVVIEQPQQPQQQEFDDIRAVAESTDWIIGSADADIFVVEYSDIECPFCKRYHDGALQRLINEYADNERVGFVFRHFPLDDPFIPARPDGSFLHPTATEAAVATECVGDLGGDEAFYTFLDAVFADDETATLSGVDLIDRYSQYALSAGVDRVAFENCYATFDTTKVEADFNDGRNAGVEGTPTVFLQTADGGSFRAQPDFGTLKNGIDVFLESNR